MRNRERWNEKKGRERQRNSLREEGGRWKNRWRLKNEARDGERGWEK